MSSTLRRLRPTPVRMIGFLAAFGLLGLIGVLPRGVELNLPMVTVGTGAPEDPGRFSDSILSVPAFLLAGPLGWLFADRAVRPGWRSALATALRVDLVAVILGSFFAAARVAVDPGVLDWIAATVVVGFLGLVFFGLPMLVLVFIVAITWVALVRAVTRAVEAISSA